MLFSFSLLAGYNLMINSIWLFYILATVVFCCSRLLQELLTKTKTKKLLDYRMIIEILTYIFFGFSYTLIIVYA